MCSPMLVISLPLWKCCGEDGPTLGRSRAAQRLSGEPRFDDDEVKAWAVALLWPLGVALALTAVGVALSCLAFCAHQPPPPFATENFLTGGWIRHRLPDDICPSRQDGWQVIGRAGRLLAGGGDGLADRGADEPGAAGAGADRRDCRGAAGAAARRLLLRLRGLLGARSAPTPQNTKPATNALSPARAQTTSRS